MTTNPAGQMSEQTKRLDDKPIERLPCPTRRIQDELLELSRRLDALEPLSPQTALKEKGEDVPARDGVSLIAAERQRQIDSEGWSAAHDDTHDEGELVDAAIRYALEGNRPGLSVNECDDCEAMTPWPWAPEWWKPAHDGGIITPRAAVRNLVKAGALIAAEIDRLQRATPPSSPSPAEQGDVLDSIDPSWGDDGSGPKPQPGESAAQGVGWYTKKPVAIQAVQFTVANRQMCRDFCPEGVYGHDELLSSDYFKIRTLEGTMRASPGDWIIKGVKGEFYPIKPDIFAETYNAARTPPLSPSSDLRERVKEVIDHWRFTTARKYHKGQPLALQHHEHWNLVDEVTAFALPFQQEIERLREILDRELPERDRLQAGWYQSDKELSAARSELEQARKVDMETLVQRFLTWPLPASVCADFCATRQGGEHRSGTNLLSAVEARTMLEHVLKGA